MGKVLGGGMISDSIVQGMQRISVVWYSATSPAMHKTCQVCRMVAISPVSNGENSITTNLRHNNKSSNATFFKDSCM